MAVVIASAVRTAITNFQGGFTPLAAPQLGAAVVRAALERAGVEAGEVDLVMMGQVLAAGAGQAPARQAAKHAGLPDRVPAVTVNKMCGSGLETVIQGARAIALGDAGVVVAGGMESMTNAPYLLTGARGGLRLGDGAVVDSILRDGLVNVYDGCHMGTGAEWCARTHGLSRAAQDDYAARSYRRAQRATAAGIAAREIVPVEVPGRKGAISTIDTDEGPARVDFDKLPTLRPVFEQAGTVTAGNASSLNDGAAALVIADETVAVSRGWPVLARIRGYAGHAQAPGEFTTAPIGAMRALYARTGWRPEEVDAYEINEAFAVVPMAAMDAFGLDPERVNVLGGAVSLGHPIGASGARILVTLLNVLQELGGRRGVASICIGGGEALAMAIERD
ncbi:MAG: thiolase family protein [Trueperaceae bacterium]|nr:thiolase family protein [Trueperaceae bacterium]